MPDASPSAPHQPHPGWYPDIHSTPTRLHRYPSPVSALSHRTVLSDVLASTIRPARCLPACSSAARPDTPDPAAHRLLPPSTPPTNPRPSPGSAPRRSPPAHPALLPVLSADAPADSPDGSAPHSSATPPHKPPPPPPASSPPAPQTTRGCTSPTDIPPPSRSTHTKS